MSSIQPGKCEPRRNALVQLITLTSNMTPAEQIAQDTWERIKQSRDVKVRLGEETFTDLLILDFIRQMGNRTKLFQSTKDQESRRGTDIEIRIHSGGNRAMAFAVQAKKLSRSDRYDALNAKVKLSGSFQIDTLESYSRSVCAIPFYLLYNYVDQRDIQPYWHCCEPLDKRQLGCTLVPSWIIRRAIETRGCRNFDWIHESLAALPWRCLFDCSQGRDYRLLPSADSSLSRICQSPLQFDSVEEIDLVPSGNEREYDWVPFEPVDGGWPDWLWSRDDAMLSDDDVDRLRHEIFRRNFGVLRGAEARELDFPPEGLPRYFLLVREDME